MLFAGISVSSPHDLSDNEVEESISSRFVEVDELDVNDEPSSQNDEELNNVGATFTDYDQSNGYQDQDYEEDFEVYNYNITYT